MERKNLTTLHCAAAVVGNGNSQFQVSHCLCSCTQSPLLITLCIHGERVVSIMMLVPYIEGLLTKSF